MELETKRFFTVTPTKEKNFSVELNFKEIDDLINRSAPCDKYGNKFFQLANFIDNGHGIIFDYRPKNCAETDAIVAMPKYIGDYDMSQVLKSNGDIEWSNGSFTYYDDIEYLYILFKGDYIFEKKIFNEFEKEKLLNYINNVKDYVIQLIEIINNLEIITKALCDKLSNEFIKCILSETYTYLEVNTINLPIFDEKPFALAIKEEFTDIIKHVLRTDFSENNYKIKDNVITDEDGQMLIGTARNKKYMNCGDMSIFSPQRLAELSNYYNTLFERIKFSCIENRITDDFIDSL